MKLSLIIPVLNEEKTIEQILQKVFAQKEVSQVVVVNDGSSDKTLSILNRISKTDSYKKRLKVLSHHKNQGKGAAIRTGIKHIKGRYLLIQDADLEYNPHEYQNLLKMATPQNAVYGSRIMGKNPHAYAVTYLGNVVITAFCNFLFSAKLTDIYTCYKLIPTRLAQTLNLSSDGFEIEAEITAKLLAKRVPIIEVPISYQPRSYAKGKKIKAKDAFKGAYKLLSLRLS